MKTGLLVHQHSIRPIETKSLRSGLRGGQAKGRSILKGLRLKDYAGRRASEQQALTIRDGIGTTIDLDEVKFKIFSRSSRVNVGRFNEPRSTAIQPEVPRAALQCDYSFRNDVHLSAIRLPQTALE